MAETTIDRIFLTSLRKFSTLIAVLESHQIKSLVPIHQMLPQISYDECQLFSTYKFLLIKHIRQVIHVSFGGLKWYFTLSSNVLP